MLHLILLVASITLCRGEIHNISITRVWDGGFLGTFTIQPGNAIHGWTAHLTFDRSVTHIDSLKARVVLTSHNLHKYTLQNAYFDGDVEAHETLTIDFIGNMTGNDAPHGTVAIHYVPITATGSSHTTHSHDTGSTPQSSTIVPSTSSLHTRYDYTQAMNLSILFYAAQRSGKLPPNNPIPWRGDSALHDGQDVGLDLTGGWYDAGDFIKFNLPMASTTTLLVWGLIRWPVAYSAAGQLDNMYDCIKWPLDYFLKCWIPHQNVYYVQVGSGQADHDYWGRPEDMTMARPSYKITSSRPGSDVAGETAAAMAAGSIAFKYKDPAYSAKLLAASRSLYVFAKTYTGKYSDSVHEVHEFYPSSGYKDELCTSAAWLYKATNETHYLNDAKHFYESDTAWDLSWDDKQISCQLLLWELTRDNKYKTNVQNFVHAFMPGSSVPYTPCGLAFRDKWGSLAYAGNAAFVALMASEDGIGGDNYKTWALSQINYILGDNKQHISFEIGFGNKYPLRPHHAASSCPNPPSACDWDVFDSHGPNAHVLNGGLVGGPGRHDDYSDDRKDYVKNEVACDYNSGFQSALAGLVYFGLHGNLPASPTPHHCH